ncbi:MAG: hypothetical protein ABW149_03235 [Sedimenticola sp.]
MKVTLLNIIVAVLALAMMLIGDYVYVYAKNDSELIKYANWLSGLGLFIAPIGFLVVNFISLKRKEIIRRTALSALIAFVLSGFGS